MMNSEGRNGSILQLHVFLLLFSGHSSAQATDGDSDMYGESYRLDPTMKIVILVLISVFFALGFLSICIRSWLERVTGMNNSHPVDAGGNWLALSRPPALGLEASVIESFPMFQYSTVKTLRNSKEALDQCLICLNEFEDFETLRLVPKCCHMFHPDCIDAWLQSHETCPLCRANLVPIPVQSVVSIQIPGLADDAPRSELTSDPMGSMDARLIDSMALTCNQSMPRRSMSTGW